MLVSDGIFYTHLTSCEAACVHEEGAKWIPSVFYHRTSCETACVHEEGAKWIPSVFYHRTSCEAACVHEEGAKWIPSICNYFKERKAVREKLYSHAKNNMSKTIKSSKELSKLTPYSLQYEEQLTDTDSLGLVFLHKKSGARVCVISNEDENKVFYIGFRTPPTNSTGVAHIVEHTVLCGSRKFPAKDPFIELAKGSLNTFLNAMTYPDKTIYPFASCNQKDFENLMDVYMDAVLYPNIYKKEELFRQEGWHYELDSPESELKLNGIVYSEMKGAFSSPEEQLFREIQESLYPDTCYGVESGGDPDVIFELTYSEFLDFHKRYYHPSNSYIYLYGDFDIEERLSWLDEAYLCKFEEQFVDSAIQLQKPFDSCREFLHFYPLGEEESMKEGTFLSWQTVVATSMDPMLSVAFDVLDRMLVSVPGAPLKQALLDAGIGKDMLGGYASYLYQPYFSITAKNARTDQKEEFLKVIHTTLEQLVHEGLNKRSLLAALNSMEFRYREGDYGRTPKGLLLGIQILNTWLYDDQSAFRLTYMNQIFEALKKKVETRYFEELIETYFLNSKHASCLVLEPKQGLNSRKEESLKSRLEEYKASLSKEEVECLVQKTRELQLFQETESTKEELEAIPILSIEDIKKEAFPFQNEMHMVDGVKLLHHSLATNEIAYIKLLFDCSRITEELVPYLGLLNFAFGNVDTMEHSYLEFTNETDLYTGGIRSDVTSYPKKEETEDFTPMFILHTKMLYEYLPKAMDLLAEMMFTSKFDDEKRLKELLGEMHSRMQANLLQSGDSVTLNRALSYISQAACFSEKIRGIDCYHFVAELLENFEEKKTVAIKNLQLLAERLFSKDTLLVSITADEDGLKKFKPLLQMFLAKIPKQTPSLAEKKLVFDLQKKNEGFHVSGQVQYVSCAGNFMKAGFASCGSLRVLKTILSLDYIWNTVRVRGGAYGGGFGYSGLDGFSFFYSFRDPNLAETVEVYKNAANYIRSFQVSERDMTKYIIGTIGGIDTPMSPAMKGARSLGAYLTGQQYEEIQKEREEILNTTVKEIQKLADFIEAIVLEDNWCIIGNEKKLKENKAVCKEIKPLL